MLPSWVDVDFVKGAASGSIIGLAVAGLIVLVLVRGLLNKLVTVVVIGALAFGVYHERTTLEACAKTCSCRLASTRIPVRTHACATRH